MEEIKYTDDFKIKALQEVNKAYRESLMCLVTMDIKLRDNKLTESEKISEINRLLEAAFGFQDVLKKYDLDILMY